MWKLLLKPWDLTDLERGRLIREMERMPISRGDVSCAVVGPILPSLPLFAGLAAQIWLDLTPRSLFVLFFASAPLLFAGMLLLNIRVVRRRVPSAIRRAWSGGEGGRPPCCPACGYRLANLGESAEMCPECGEPALPPS